MYRDEAYISQFSSFAERISEKVRETRLMQIVDRVQWVLILAAFFTLWLSVLLDKRKDIDE